MTAALDRLPLEAPRGLPDHWWRIHLKRSAIARAPRPMIDLLETCLQLHTNGVIAWAIPATDELVLAGAGEHPLWVRSLLELDATHPDLPPAPPRAELPPPRPQDGAHTLDTTTGLHGHPDGTVTRDRRP